jgi:hypothetical protein
VSIGRLTRRQLLVTTAALAATGLAGCSGSEPSPTLTVRVNNRTGAGHRVTVTVTDDRGGVRERTPEGPVQGGVSRSFEFDGDPARRYEIGVTGDGWAGGGRWEPAVCPQHRLEVRLEGEDDRPSVVTESTCTAGE